MKASLSFCPRAGRVVAQLSFEGETTDWTLLELDEPFEYQLQEGLNWRLIRVTHFLIRSRWQGYKVGEAAPTSVFILTVEEGAVPVASPINIEDYMHAAWGMCHVEQDGV
jgi:hypothetical protein